MLNEPKPVRSETAINPLNAMIANDWVSYGFLAFFYQAQYDFTFDKSGNNCSRLYGSFKRSHTDPTGQKGLLTIDDFIADKCLRLLEADDQ